MEGKPVTSTPDDATKEHVQLQDMDVNGVDQKPATPPPSATGGCCQCGCLKKISNGIVQGLETVFYKLGKLIARNPYKTIVLSLLVCGVAGLGLIKWHEETEYVEIWLPRGSRVYDEYLWVQDNFPASFRFESVIVEDENVLSPNAINAIFDVYKTAINFKTADGHTLQTLCVKAGPVCRVSNILELWAYNETVIRDLTEGEIQSVVNQNKIISPVTRNEMNLDKLLGGIQRDGRGHVVGAMATTMFWFLERNDSSLNAALDWEAQLISLINDNGHDNLTKLYIYTARTFSDEAMGALSSDVDLLTIGFSLVLFYFALSISKYSLIEQKIFLGLAGLLSIGLALVFTYGVGFGTGIMFGPIHQITPFMLLGIGVDDMFVILESLNHLTRQEKTLPVEERIAFTLKHAGVSITVTSVTDIVAFGIGGSTVIPSLSTFCAYASIGVLALYLLQATYFVACVTLDERRIDARRDACLPCCTHAESSQNKFFNFSLQHLFMKNVLGPLLTLRPIKVLVILVALGLGGVNIWSITLLKYDFDPSMYLPSDSYSERYVVADRKYFPDDGAFVSLYCDDMNYTANIDELLALHEAVMDKASVQRITVDFWLDSFKRWLNTPTDTVVTNTLNGTTMPHATSKFFPLLTQFLQTNHGQAYNRFIKLNDRNHPTDIQGSVMTFRHVKCKSSACNIDAMMDMRDLVDNYKFKGGGKCFVYSEPQYMFNETNMVLNMELLRNLLLAAACVFVVTLILIANIWTSVLVFICVVFTVVDVAGTMQFWDISVDTASSVILILCFGLSVDYSAHIGHAFMTVTGSNNDRARKALVSIGPAVFSGGFSTFLAFLLLINSKSYGFTLFFRIFTSVVIFGLFHGLIVLPVVLSLAGPAPYQMTINVTDFEMDIKYSDVKGSPSHNAANHTGDIPQSVSANGSISPSESHTNEAFSTIEHTANDHKSSSLYFEQLSNGSMVEITAATEQPNTVRL